MSRVALTLLRLCIILAGYGLAALAASLFLHFIAWPAIGPVGEREPWLLVGGLVVSVPMVALLAASFTLLPASLLIGLAELRSYKSWLYHALSGGIAAFTALLFARGSDGLPGGSPPVPDQYGELPLIWTPEIMAAVVAAGLTGGIAYWAVAGRSAGRWRIPTAPAPSGS